jgi:DNA repair protein RadC
MQTQCLLATTQQHPQIQPSQTAGRQHPLHLQQTPLHQQRLRLQPATQQHLLLIQVATLQQCSLSKRTPQAGVLFFVPKKRYTIDMQERRRKTKKYTIQALPSELRPRERLFEQGPDVLKHAELLAIIFNTGHKGEGVLELASRILSEYGSKAITRERSVERLMGELGIGQLKASQIIACFELGRRFYQEDSGRMPSIRGAEDVYEYLKDMSRLKKEVLRGLYLNVRNKLIHDEVISIGTLTNILVHPREVFGPAIEFSAAALIVAHNHPSGGLELSSEDKEVTKRLKEAGKVLGIPLLDHVIIAKKSYFSSKDNGLM